MGVEPCPGPGTVATSLQQVRQAVLAACAHLVEAGARRVVLVTFHGAPLHSLALDAGRRFLESRGVAVFAPLNLVIADLLADRVEAVRPAFEVVDDPALREQLVRDVGLDFHAGFFETSLSLHYARDTVSEDWRALPACPGWQQDRAVKGLSRLAAAVGADGLSRELDFVGTGLGWYGLRPFPGYTGRPGLARPEAGARFAGALVARFAEHATSVFVDREPPQPPAMAWLAPLTLVGRLGKVKIGLGEIAV